MFAKKDFKITVYTGDKKGAGTDAKVWLQIVDEARGSTQAILLNNLFENKLGAGEASTYYASAAGVNDPKKKIDHIVVWRDDFGIAPDWFLDRIEIEDNIRQKQYIYPAQRWINPNKNHFFYEYDDFLPSKDKQSDRRLEELNRIRESYKYIQRFPNGPQQLRMLPSDEDFSCKYRWDINAKVAKYKIEQIKIKFATTKWNNFQLLENVFKVPSDFPTPKAIAYWKEDEWFGRQRIDGVNPTLIRLCKEIPQKLAVSSEELQQFLEGRTLADALKDNKIFIIDLYILEGVFARDAKKMVAPIVLFYLNNDNKIMPICIQLYQEPGEGNPLYFPNDSEWTWIMAKMFYNMAEAQHHQSIAHLGLTHILMEGFCICTHRHLSPSHPINRLLAPHFLYLLAINDLAVKALINPGGWVDKTMNTAVAGMGELVVRAFKEWHMDKSGCLITEFEERGVSDPKILPNYHYRDDATELYNIIEKYVAKIVHHYYESVDAVKGDWELQAWAKEMSTPLEAGGLGINGAPTNFSTLEEVVKICTCIITTCSVQHAAVNFQQYDQYAFLPNFPGSLLDVPPVEKRAMTEEEVAGYIPPIDTMLSLMVITRILSDKGTNSLGDFEVQYLYAPEAVTAANEFRSDLKKMHDKIVARNETSKYKFEWLDPVNIPNAISI